MPHPAAPIRSITFCGVSTGIYGYPLVAATHVALETTRRWLEVHHDKVDMIVFCTFLEKEWDCYEQLLPYYFPPAPDAEFKNQWDAAKAPVASSSADSGSDSDSSSDSEWTQPLWILFKKVFVRNTHYAQPRVISLEM